jgi:tRNA pseudouridine(55) synthase
MAEGVLVALVGSANLRREQYLSLSKEYTLDVLFGFATDTYDVLGKVVEKGDPSSVKQREVAEALGDFCGEVSQEYPPYSSKVVEGKSLFEWARTNALGTLILPRRTVTIDSIELRGMYRLPEGELLYYIEQKSRTSSRSRVTFGRRSACACGAASSATRGCAPSPAPRCTSPAPRGPTRAHSPRAWARNWGAPRSRSIYSAPG